MAKNSDEIREIGLAVSCCPFFLGVLFLFLAPSACARSGGAPQGLMGAICSASWALYGTMIGDPFVQIPNMAGTFFIKSGGKCTEGSSGISGHRRRVKHCRYLLWVFEVTLVAVSSSVTQQCDSKSADVCSMRVRG